jgi:hypothetical protein
MYWVVVKLVVISLFMLAWLFFRRSGVSFQTGLQGVPLWRSNQYLKPAGTVLWFAGCIVAAVGGILFMWVLRSGR